MTKGINRAGFVLIGALLAITAWQPYSALARSPSTKSAMVDDSQWRGGPTEDWFVNWDKALAEAKRTDKAMFLLSTGSDWCFWCKKLKAEVLDKPEFVEFAKDKLVLVYLDSPSRNPLGKSQKAHNRLITRALPFGGGVPNVLVMNAKGKKLGAIGGGGLAVEPYLDKLRGILNEEGSAVKGTDAKRLFTEGYSVLAAEVAARIAALPPVKKGDFKAKLTGVAVVDDSRRRGKKDDIEFKSPETELEVPFGKIALFRVEYDFPEGYGARVWTRGAGPFGYNPSGTYKGKGTVYGFLSLLDRGGATELREISIKTNSDPELDDFPYGWEIGKFPVNLKFKAKLQDEAADAQSTDNNVATPAKSDDAKGGATDDRFFPVPANRSKINARELQQRKTNAKSDFELTSFAGIQFGMSKADGVPALDKPYHRLSIVKRASYSGGKLSGLTLAAPVKEIRAMSADEFRNETCKLVQAIEEDLSIRFAVSGSKIDFTGRKTVIVVSANRSSGILTVQLTKKK